MAPGTSARPPKWSNRGKPGVANQPSSIQSAAKRGVAKISSRGDEGASQDRLGRDRMGRWRKRPLRCDFRRLVLRVTRRSLRRAQPFTLGNGATASATSRYRGMSQRNTSVGFVQLCQSIPHRVCLAGRTTHVSYSRVRPSHQGNVMLSNHRAKLRRAARKELRACTDSGGFPRICENLRAQNTCKRATWRDTPA